MVFKLDTDLAKRNGEENQFFAQFNKTDTINYVVIIYLNDSPIGCGAIKKLMKI